jgi:hypothetical protein
MKHPDFFMQAETITLHDGLAEFLGAADGGLITYTYLDAVKLAGHSCPTVAGAWLMTARALRALYPDRTPERGTIRAEFRDPEDSGVTGVIANVVSLVTGTAQAGGFKGIAGNFDRRHLLSFKREGQAEIRFTRLDNQAAVEVSYHPELVPASTEMKALMQKALARIAGPEEMLQFTRLWQERVKRILIDHANMPGLVELSPVTAIA